MTEDNLIRGNKLLEEINKTKHITESLKDTSIETIYVSYYTEEKEKSESFKIEGKSELHLIIIKFYEEKLRQQLKELEEL